MAEGMPYFKLPKAPVESCAESLADIEQQASLLFEEFLRLPQPANAKLNLKRSKAEASDSPVILEEKGHSKRGAVECDEAEEDDLVTDSEVIVKGSNGVTPPPKDPKLTELAQQMQQAGDALYERYGSRVDGVESHLVSFVLNNSAGLTYERLSREIDNMVGRDRNWSNFIMASYVARRVCIETSNACSAVTSYFQQYLGQSYSRPMQQAGGIAPFVKSKGH